MSTSVLDQEISVIAQTTALPANMQLIFMQLVSAIEAAISELQSEHASSNYIGTEFLDALIDRLLLKPLSKQELAILVKSEIRQQFASACSSA